MKTYWIRTIDPVQSKPIIKATKRNFCASSDEEAIIKFKNIVRKNNKKYYSLFYKRTCLLAYSAPYLYPETNTIVGGFYKPRKSKK